MELAIAFVTLAFLEVVLGVDNIIFISIVTNKLPEKQQPKARVTGLGLALVFRIALLVSLTWLLKHLTTPLFEIHLPQSLVNHNIMHESVLPFSIREIILFAGGLFLLAKSTSEIHHKVEGGHDKTAEIKAPSFSKAILQIILLDIVFSFDSILTAVGLTNNLIVMIAAVVVAMIIMMLFAGKIAAFINKRPTLEILALSFLILIGFMLVLEGVHIEIPKGYIYFAVFFAMIVEVINIKTRKTHNPVDLHD